MSNPTSYNIQISEEQRLALLALIAPLNLNNETDPNEEHPLHYWKEMLEGLPKDEMEDPKVTHGFCL